MQIFEPLDDNNFLLYAARNYHNPRCIDAEEFYDDLNRFKYLKRLINRYVQYGELSERLMLNHFTIIFNAFGIESGLKMLEYKIEKNDWSVVKPFLVFLKVITADKYTDIKMDSLVVEQLRKIP